MFGWLAKLAGSGLVSLLGDGILKPVLAHLDTKAAADRDKAVAQTGADRDRAGRALLRPAGAG